MIYLWMFGGIFWLEFLIKNIVEKKGKSGVTKTLFGGKIMVKKFHNRGFALNKMETKQKAVAAVALVFTIIMTLVSLVYWRKTNKIMKTGLALVLGGAYSNTYDRLYRKYVVDYFSFGVKNKRLRKIVFNLADFGIMIGAVLIVIGGIADENISKGQICGKGNGRPGGAQ